MENNATIFTQLALKCVFLLFLSFCVISIIQIFNSNKVGLYATQMIGSMNVTRVILLVFKVLFLILFTFLSF